MKSTNDLFCCKTLITTRHMSQRYFSQLNIVYVKKLQTFVLTNKRRYVYVPEIDTYMLEQSLRYEILDYCPFCGQDLKHFRITTDENELDVISKAIKKWRTSPRSPYSDVKLEFNCYDCFWSASKILGDKYLGFDDSYGLDYFGNIYKGADFVTVNKVFELIQKCNAYYCYEGDRKDFNDFYRDTFLKRKVTTEDDKWEFYKVIDNFLWLVFHNEKCLYDELMKYVHKQSTKELV